ncbi:putative small nucleolar ribonucleoprotein complex subunit Utp14 [Penicillium brasilianum]|uniref:Putative small nucleolar ribonucleoprotein complex subunit Utp14 n=1 Tax=Penicillium brasilianum TaxID=104259 RepID=A0A1S9RTC2_PENBI|nr:putative small nucleolar ribonucleoprotein complex subunit Utp14 [Penicillium brasilianum]
MPRQQTQSRAPKERSARKPPAQRGPKGRGLDALSRAEEQIPTKLGVRRNRLGDYDDGTWRKRPTNDDDDDDDEDNEPRPNYKRRRTDASDEGGSDSEGHEWKLGQVDTDDDESLDSDEALGSSDEERFEGFTFRGSSSNKSKPKPKKSEKKKRTEISLSEDFDDSDKELSDEEEDDEDDEDGIDLLTAWDMNTAAEEKAAQKAADKARRAADGEDSDEDSGSEGDSEDDPSDDDTDLSLSDDDADTQKNGLSKLQDFVKSMEVDRSKKPKQRSQEQSTPTEYGLTSSRKLTVADLLPSITDSRLKSSLKHVDAAPQTTKSGIPGKLDAPLAKRQQDKLDRAAAYEKSKETLDRWLETVKANRKAEHLTFPLPDPDAQQFHRLDVAKPKTDLEATIQEILVESGLAEANGKSAEDQVQGFEELKARTLPIEEIQARRAELRKRRDLLFREEVRAKRIKKIKSKSYRRVHRKERERLEQQERQALLEAGVDLDEAERDENERKRAEARMGSKHRDSKWAKSNKQTGRTAWDEEARNSAADQAMREEELRKRIEGKHVSRGDEDYLGSSSSESEDEDPWASDAEDREKRKLQEKLAALEGGASDDEIKGPHSTLFSMKFMRNAEATRKEQNEAELRRLNRELHGGVSESEAESETGRRKFGQSDKAEAKSQARVLPKDDLEDALDSDDENHQRRAAEQDVDIIVDRPPKQKSAAVSASKAPSRSNQKMFSQENEPAAEEENPWLVQTERNNRRRTGTDAQETIDISLDAQQPQISQAKTPAKKDKAVKAVSSHRDEEIDSDDDNVPVLLKNHDLVKRAFAGDEVVQDFEQEKMDTIADEGDKVVDNTLEGWGSWAGDGISNREKKRQKRNLITVEGVKPEKRKDAKLSRVIINEKRIQKNKKYMASQLPHEFETKAQYERSLRMPIGPEWSTKETYQASTKPRVMIKQGIIKPLEKPLL